MKQTRQIILELVTAAVRFYNRPVCYADLLELSKESKDFQSFGIRRIKDDVRWLLNSGNLIKAGNNKGNGLGRLLYLPANTVVSEADRMRDAAPVQIVADAFKNVWKQNVSKAETCGALPDPVFTGDIGRYLAERNFKFADKRTLPNSLIHLAQVPNGGIRKVERPNDYIQAWAPAEVPDAELNVNNLYASDSERIKTAVQRACAFHGRAASNIEITQQILSDPKLKLEGSSSASVQLNDAAKEKFYAKGKVYNSQSKSLSVRKAGQFNGTAYYFFGKKKDKIKYSAHVSFLNLRLRWEQAGAAKQLEEIEGCRLPTIAAGRALLVLSEANKVAAELNDIISFGVLTLVIKCEAEQLYKNVAEVTEQAREWIENKNLGRLNLPAEVDAATAGLTAEELLPLILPFYPKAKEIKKAHKLVTLLDKDIRRLPNPNYKNRFGSNPREAASFLFDQTDALLFVARNWGGYECSMQANLAGTELGNLRDVRFIVPALESSSFDERLGSAACLAFLKNREGNKYLRKAVLEDCDPNIRQSALWAYCFAQEPDAKDLARQIAKDDLNKNVRAFAQIILESEYEDLWRI